MVLLDHAMALLAPGVPIATIEVVKFVGTVLPGQAVEVAAERRDGRLHFVCQVAGRTVLRGSAA